MRDIGGKTLEVGDKVSYCVPYYKNLEVGHVNSFTPKGIRVATGDIHYDGRPVLLQRSEDQVSKID